eukprot:gene13421-biopygen9094
MGKWTSACAAPGGALAAGPASRGQGDRSSPASTRARSAAPALAACRQPTGGIPIGTGPRPLRASPAERSGRATAGVPGGGGGTAQAALAVAGGERGPRLARREACAAGSRLPWGGGGWGVGPRVGSLAAGGRRGGITPRRRMIECSDES